MIGRRSLIASAASLLAMSAHAQSFPGKGLQRIVPFAHGGAAHIIGRVVSERLTAVDGQSVNSLIAGRDDPATPVAMLEEIAAAVRGANLTTISNAAHLPAVEQPLATAELLRRSIASVRYIQASDRQLSTSVRERLQTARRSSTPRGAGSVAVRSVGRREQCRMARRMTVGPLRRDQYGPSAECQREPPRFSQSVGRVGASDDNALAETINGLYEAEVNDRRGPWRSFEAVAFATLTWVDGFNNRRMPEPIGDIAPVAAEGRRYAMLEEQRLAA